MGSFQRTEQIKQQPVHPLKAKSGLLELGEVASGQDVKVTTLNFILGVMRKLEGF